MRPAVPLHRRSAGGSTTRTASPCRDGEYHVVLPVRARAAPSWAPNCHWGHAKGADLFSLAELPIALAPGEGDDGIWTGSARDRTTTAARRIFYTSTTAARHRHRTRPRRHARRRRTGSPGRRAASSPRRPPSSTSSRTATRSSCKEPDGWRMFLGAGLADGTATALSYRSADLAEWEYEGIALQRSTHEVDPVWMGALWECPQIIEVDGRHVMVSSVWDDDVLHYAGYAVGTLRGRRLHRRVLGAAHLRTELLRAIVLPRRGRPAVPHLLDARRRRRRGGLGERAQRAARAHARRRHAGRHPAPRPRRVSRGRVADDGRLPGLAGDRPSGRPPIADELRISSGGALGRRTPSRRRRARRCESMTTSGRCRRRGDPGPARRAGAGGLIDVGRVRGGHRTRRRPPRRRRVPWGGSRRHELAR